VARCSNPAARLEARRAQRGRSNGVDKTRVRRMIGEGEAVALVVRRHGVVAIDTKHYAAGLDRTAAWYQAAVHVAMPGFSFPADRLRARSTDAVATATFRASSLARGCCASNVLSSRSPALRSLAVECQSRSVVGRGGRHDVNLDKWSTKGGYSATRPKPRYARNQRQCPGHDDAPRRHRGSRKASPWRQRSY
jgi:hypothetical protein